MPRINIAPVKTYKSSSRASLAHLFTTDNNDTSFDQLKKNTNWKVTYKNGMFITISNHKTTYETIRGAYKKQYQSLLIKSLRVEKTLTSNQVLVSRKFNESA